MKKLIALLFVGALCITSSKYDVAYAGFAENPYNCDITSYVGKGVTVSVHGITAAANKKGYIHITFSNAGYSCSINGAGCIQGFTCSDFYTKHGILLQVTPE